MKSSGTTGRRRWFRVRFGLRTLLLVTTLVAVWLGLESRRARQQQDLVARIEELKGEYARAPRDHVPQIMHRLLNEDQGCFVESVSVSAFIAPIDFTLFGTVQGVPWESIYAPEDMQELLRMPGMGEVRKLELYGTAMTDDLVDELATLDDLEAVTFDQAVVTESAVARLRQLRPDCTIAYLANSNGPEMLEEWHHRASFMTDDLTVFPRALRGDRKSIDVLMQTVDWDTDTYLKNNPAATRSLVKKARQLWPERADLDDRELLDQVVMDFPQVRGKPTELLLLSSTWRKETFSDELAAFLSLINRDLMREPLRDAFDHGSQELRSLAVRVSGRLGDVDLLNVALSDPVVGIRIMAVGTLSTVGNEQALASIDKAYRDEHPSVREAALRELAACSGNRFLDTFLEACHDEHPSVRVAALRDLAARNGNRFLDTFLEAMADPDADVRWQAAYILWQYPDARSVPVLTKALKDENPMIRCSAATTLGKIADPSTELALAAATEDEDSLVRGAAEKALAAVRRRCSSSE